MKNHYFKIALCLLLTQGFSGSVLAANPQYLTSFFSDNALRLTEKGDHQLAVKEFIKAVFADPANEEARARLKAVLAKVDWPRQERLQLMRFVELVDYTSFLMARQDRLHKNNDRLLSFILEHGQEDPGIVNEARLLKDAKLKQAETLQLPAEWKELKDADWDVPDMTSELDGFKDVLVARLDILRDGNNQLRRLKMRVVTRIRSSSKKQMREDWQQQMQSIQLEIKERDDKLMQQQEQFKQLQLELRTMLLSFETMQDKLRQTDQRVVDLTRDIAGMSLENYEKGERLRDKEARLTELEDQWQEAQQRLTLVQRIIQEKDERIQVLEEEMITLQDGLSSSHEFPSKLAGDMLREMQDIKADLRSRSSDSYQKILALERNFHGLANKFSEVETRLSEKEGHIQALTAEVLLRDEKISRYKNIFVSKDRKLLEMNGMLAIYRGRLQDTRQQLTAKDDQLQSLRDQLQSLEDQLDQVVKRNNGREPETTYLNLSADIGPNRGAFSRVPLLTQQEILMRTSQELNSSHLSP